VACQTIVDKAVVACQEFAPKSVVIGGGVAANSELRRQLSERLPVAAEYPPLKLCGDNGAMIAALGCFQATCSRSPVDPYLLEASPGLSM
jgi:N6-L-threonylcarbamoyladenine synthase